MRNFIEQGDFLTIKTDQELKSGDLFIEGELVGVCATDSDIGGFAITTQGVFELKKEPKIAINLGQKVYSKKGEALTTTATGATYVGISVERSGINAPTIKIRLG